MNNLDEELFKIKLKIREAELEKDRVDE